MDQEFSIYARIIVQWNPGICYLCFLVLRVELSFSFCLSYSSSSSSSFVVNVDTKDPNDHFPYISKTLLTESCSPPNVFFLYILLSEIIIKLHHTPLFFLPPTISHSSSIAVTCISVYVFVYSKYINKTCSVIHCIM